MSLILHTPFHTRASTRWLTPIVKQSSIMWPYVGSPSHFTVAQSFANGRLAPNHVLERMPHTTVADEKTVSSVSQLRTSAGRCRMPSFGLVLRQPHSVSARMIAPYPPSPTSIAKNSEK